jgi:hypothetical protein
MPRRLRLVKQGKERMVFFEKKNQKTFANWVEPIQKDRSLTRQKFFASFFQKRRP